jgi:hypothetical protein
MIIWILLLPFIVIVWSIRIIISRLKFKNQLKKSGVPKKWAKKLSGRYSLRFRDVIDIIKLSKESHRIHVD